MLNRYPRCEAPFAAVELSRRRSNPYCHERACGFCGQAARILAAVLRQADGNQGAFRKMPDGLRVGQRCIKGPRPSSNYNSRKLSRSASANPSDVMDEREEEVLPPQSLEASASLMSTPAVAPLPTPPTIDMEVAIRSAPVPLIVPAMSFAPNRPGEDSGCDDLGQVCIAPTPRLLWKPIQRTVRSFVSHLDDREEAIIGSPRESPDLRCPPSVPSR